MSSLQGQEYGFGSGAPFLSWNPVSAGKKGTDVLGRSYGSEPWVMREALDLMGWEKKKTKQKNALTKEYPHLIPMVQRTWPSGL